MARVILLLGGNIGKMKQTLHHAQRLINARCGAVLRCSHRYQSEAWGFSCKDPFTNQALEISTDLQPEELLDEIHSIENELGRNRQEEALLKEQTGERYTSRTIDIDIMFYDERIIATPRLEIPHPRMAEREFALRPMAEIAPEKRHPQTQQTIKQMLESLKANPQNR